MTDAPKFTPGPWKACKNGQCSCGQVWSIPDDHPVASATETPWGDRYHVAAPTDEDPEAVRSEFMEYGAFPEEEFHANAQLIAEAPAMYAALDALCTAYAECNGEDHPAYRNAIAVLAKARGAP